MNHTQIFLLNRAKEIREEERNNSTWGGPDPRGKDAHKAALDMADELERIAKLKT